MGHLWNDAKWPPCPGCGQPADEACLEGCADAHAVLQGLSDPDGCPACAGESYGYGAEVTCQSCQGTGRRSYCSIPLYNGVHNHDGPCKPWTT